MYLLLTSECRRCKNMFDAIRNKLGPLSVLVNNAGVVRDNILLRMKDDEWESV